VQGTGLGAVGGKSLLSFGFLFVLLTFFLWTDLFQSHVCLKNNCCCCIHVCPRKKFKSDVSAHLWELCEAALINCLFLLIRSVCGIVVLISVCIIARTVHGC